MKPEITLHVADYTDMPLGRNEFDGPINGADYRDNILIPALDDYEFVTIDFSNVLGTAPSFLEEVFGGIIRKKYITATDLKRRLAIVYRLESVKKNINKYIDEAQKKLDK